MVASKILFAEGNFSKAHYLKEHLESKGWQVSLAVSARRILQHLNNVDLVVYEVPAGCGCHPLTVVKAIREKDHLIPIIIITDASSERLAIEALHYGVSDYFKSPLDIEGLLQSITSLLRHGLNDAAMGLCPPKVVKQQDDYTLIGRSLEIDEIRSAIKRIAKADSNVLVTGETGTGKELVAQLLHKNSRRYQKRLVCINCAAIPDSLLESELFGHEKGSFTGATISRDGHLKQADKGTLFLDEIGDMSPLGQAKIVRAIETKQVQRVGGENCVAVNMRVIAATNQELEQKIINGEFRKDLFFRLNVVRLHLPPLRDRKEDIDLLCNHFINQFNLQFGQEIVGLSDAAQEWFINYSWPGNVRELKNVIEATFINEPKSRIQVLDLPKWFQQCIKKVPVVTEKVNQERDKLLAALLSSKWNKSQAAKKLNWSRMTLYRKMTKYRITESRNSSDLEEHNV